MPKTNEKLTRREKEVLRWMYGKAEGWKGGLMPDEYPDYESVLGEAKKALAKVGVRVK